MPDYLQVAVDAGVATITLHDPDRRNALNAEMNRQIVEALDELEARDDIGSLVVTGSAPAFCAGANLGELQVAAAEHRLGDFYSGFLRVANSSLPTIAAVNGAAVGAGMNLALSCDLILAGNSARFETRFLKLGLHPGGGHAWRMARFAGVQALNAMLVFGEAIDGERAAACGLAWASLPDDELLGRAQSLAARAAQVPRALMGRVRATIDALPGIDTSDDAVALELDPQAWSATQPAFQERIAAQLAGGR